MSTTAKKWIELLLLIVVTFYFSFLSLSLSEDFATIMLLRSTCVRELALCEVQSNTHTHTSIVHVHIEKSKYRIKVHFLRCFSLVICLLLVVVLHQVYTLHLPSPIFVALVRFFCFFFKLFVLLLLQCCTAISHKRTNAGRSNIKTKLYSRVESGVNKSKLKSREQNEKYTLSQDVVLMPIYTYG